MKKKSIQSNHDDNFKVYIVTCPECEAELEVGEIPCLCPLCFAMGGKCRCYECGLREECNKPCERELV